MGKNNSESKGSIFTQVKIISVILFACLIINVIASVTIQYTQIRSNVSQMLTENLSGASQLVLNGIDNLNILISDHSYDYQFLEGSAEDRESHADLIAGFDDNVFGLTYIGADGTQYGEGVDESIKSDVFSQGTLLTTPTGEDGELYFGVKNDMGALVSHMKAQKLATFLEGSACDAFILSKDGTVIAANSHSGDYDKAYPDYVQADGASFVNPLTGGHFMNGYCYAGASIPGTDGWTVLVRAQSGEFYSGLVSAFWVNVLLVIIMGVLGILTLAIMKKTIVSPIKVIRDKIVEMSNGNISGGNAEIKGKGELADLACAVNRMSEFNREIIHDIQYTAEQIAAENLLVHPKAEYSGDFIPIKNALESIVDSLKEVVANVEAAASDVKNSSVQMSTNSSALSQAAREESQIVDELNTSLSGVHRQIKESAEKAVEAREVGEESVRAMNEGNEKMTRMLAAMDEIKQTSSQIANIIKTIQDISFQTNILSLNASIEAARAGAAGKGFAIVANEVGALANKTAEAAKSTTELIDTSLKSVNHGSDIANETAEMLASVLEKMTRSADMINEIADASVEQAQSINNVVDGVNRIAGSVDHVNTSAAECSSSADVLSRESEMLYSTIESFITDGKTVKKEAAPVVERKTAQTAKPAEAPKPVQTAKPAKPAEASKPVQTAKPAEAPKPVQSAKPAKPAEAPKPVQSAKPVKPAEAPKPVQTAKPAKPAEAPKPVVKPNPMPKIITLDENEEKKAEALKAAASPKATAYKTEAPKPASKPAPRASSVTQTNPIIKPGDLDVLPSGEKPTVVTKATMTPVNYTITLDSNKY